MTSTAQHGRESKPSSHLRADSVLGGTQGENGSAEPASPRLRAQSALGLGTTHVTVTSPEYREKFADAWKLETKERRERYEKLAGPSGSSRWHHSRAKGLKTSPLHKSCETQKFVSCGCKAFPVGGCRSKLCRVCNAAKWGTIRRKVLRSLEANGASGWRMMTLCGPPRENQASTLDSLQKAWARMRAWLYKDFGKSFEFVAVVEVGTRNGLVHMHVMAKFPRKYISYSDIGSQWERAYPGAGSQGVHFSRHGKKNGPKTSVFAAKTGAMYIAKYATKGSEVLKLTAEKAAQTLAAMIGRRLVRASRGFWTKPCATCEDCGWKYGVAQGHRAQEHAIGIYQSKKLARDARKAAREFKAIETVHYGGATLEWARGSANTSVLVETAGANVAWLGNRTGNAQRQWNADILHGIEC